MKILIAEDDLTSRQFIYKYMSAYGECDVTVDGIEAIDAFILGLDSETPYDLICLDVMMPKIDGIRVFKTIREIEKIRGIPEEKKVKVLVTTAFGLTDYVKSAFESNLEVYINKPIDINKIEEAMKRIV